MNGYEFVGMAVVWVIAAVIALYMLAWVVRYFSIAGAMIYTHCIKGVGTKEEFKKKRFWRIRLAFMLFFRWQYITSFFGSESISCPFYYIELNRLVPRVIFYNGE